jgi:hypothetical protein
MDQQQPEKFSQWAVLELMGHRRLAGLVTEEQIAGAGVLRLDVPGEDGQPGVTQFYSPTALYCITPTTEEIARAMAKRYRPEPVHRYELAALAAPSPRPADEHDDDRDVEDED